MNAEQAEEITPAVATWLGWQAARKDRITEGRDLVPEEYEPNYDVGTTLPEDMSVVCPAPDALRRKLLRWLGGEPEKKRKAVPIDVKLSDVVRRKDIGTATRYDVTLERRGKVVRLRDLLAGDLLTWSRLRPVALDAGLVMPDLDRGQGKLWLLEVEQAIEEAKTVQLAPEESEAGEIMDVLTDIISDAPVWEWAEDDPYPRGVARVVKDGREGWTRGPVQDAIRAKLGRVSRVQLTRALRHLELSRSDWRIETAYVRVWSRPITEGGES
jgi:hypothetical protein